MLSIITVSINVTLYNNLKENIQKTFGNRKFELIRIDNLVEKKSITKAYNSGIKRARYPFLLFIHEDVIFHTPNWGDALISQFQKDPEIGIIGVAGSKIITKIPSAWWEHNTENLVVNIIQHYPTGKVKNINQGFSTGDTEEVVVVDGVFIAMRANDKIRFNEKMQGFHNYDQSISLDYKKSGYKVMAVNTILIEHFSSGNKNSDWIKSTVHFFNLYRPQLPQFIAPTTIDKKGKDLLYLKFINSCKRTGNDGMAFRFWILYFLRNPFERMQLKEFKYFIKQFLSI